MRPTWSVVLMAIAGASAANTPAAVTSVFRVFTDQLSWQAARSACQAKGGDLATISTQADNDAVLAVLRSAHSSGRWPKSNGYGGAWIGAEDMSKEGRFDWVLDREGSKYSNFNQGEPNNFGNEDCVAMWGEDTDGKPPGSWNDDKCSAQHPYVCAGATSSESGPRAESGSGAESGPAQPPPCADASVAFDFSDEPEGKCPRGWTCSSGARVSDSQPCTIGRQPDKRDAVGTFQVGCDSATGRATSNTFQLPAGTNSMRFYRMGGADAGSGLYLIKAGGSVETASDVLCRRETGKNTDIFFEEECDGLEPGTRVYILLRDAQKSTWGKVFIKDIRFVDATGAVLPLPCGGGGGGGGGQPDADLADSGYFVERCKLSSLYWYLSFLGLGGTIIFFHFNGPCNPKPRWQDKLCEPHLWRTAPNPACLLLGVVLAIMELVMGITLVMLDSVPPNDDPLCELIIKQGDMTTAGRWGIAHLVLGIWSTFWLLAAHAFLQKYRRLHGIGNGARTAAQPQPAQPAQPREAEPVVQPVPAQPMVDIQMVEAVPAGVMMANQPVEAVVMGIAMPIFGFGEGVGPTAAAATPPSLRELCEVLRSELGMPAGYNLVQVVDEACKQLAVEGAESGALIDRARRCYEALGSPGGLVTAV